jgi:hypothetical protein
MVVFSVKLYFVDHQNESNKHETCLLVNYDRRVSKHELHHRGNSVIGEKAMIRQLFKKLKFDLG